MKKLTTIAVVALAVCGSAFAQGTLTCVNNAATVIQTDTSAISGNAKSNSAAGSVKLQIYYVPETGAFASTAPAAINASGVLGPWVALGATESLIAPGRFSSGTRSTGNEVTGGASVWLDVVGWLGSYADLATALAQSAPPVVGFSGVWSNVTGAPNGAPPTNPQPLVLGPTGFNGLTVAPVPEPSTIALGGLAAAAFLAFRRRK